ncbi:MAG: amidohydrolase [Deltaproteobacteria bacterium]|nr:amidohydrolase [Deltaproteobacteria bacterium]
MKNQFNDIGKSTAHRAFINGRIYTLDRKQPWAESVAVRDGRITFVGSSSALEETVGPETEVVDLDGKMMLPGFIDSHAHVSWTTNEAASLEMFHLDSLEAYLEAVGNFAADHPEHDVIYGAGWHNNLFPPSGPVKEDLDTIVPDRPVCLTSEDGHFSWVNSKTIARAGITRETPNPAGGVIERDPGTGEPSGTFRETARDLVQNVLPPFTVDQLKGSIRNFMQEAARVGITSVHDPLLILPEAAGQLNGFGAVRNNIQAYAELARDGELTLRVRGTVLTDPTLDAGQVRAITSACNRNADPLFQVAGIKVFVDGVVEGGTAYLLEPYAHMPESRGEPLWTQEGLNLLFEEADRDRLQIHIHAIGDAAIRMSLDALEYARKKNGSLHSRHLITHLQLLDRADIARMAALKVIGVPQPFWHVKGSYFYDLEVAYLGEGRALREYPMKSLSDAGILLAGASDYPVQVPSPPLLGIALGVTRCEPGETDPEEILGPEERMSVEEMIACFTINGARANFMENETGSIEVGKKADMVVLENNLFDIPAGTIPETRVLMTVFEGRTVHRAASI